ncbi:MAG TPA: S-layer homology domain-containing protein [Thermoanaerobaculia bacterium]|nr:S-layer homology domain-containing protein [Thermoanaerobaculia bacterium]
MRFLPPRRPAAKALCAALAVFVGAAAALVGTCGPFTDVAADAFCQFVLEIFYLGITTGTTATTYDPASPVSRLQMAAFLSRSVDAALKRGSRRAALGSFAVPQNALSLGLTTVGAQPQFVACDGADVWVANFSFGTVSRVRASDGRLLETWTGATSAYGIVAAMGRILVAGQTIPGKLYQIDPSQPAGAVTVVASNLGGSSRSVAFDGARVWVANSQGSVSIITPGASIPWTATTITTGFTQPNGVIFDGANVWVTDTSPGRIFKLDSTGAILLTVTHGGNVTYPVFDGTNIWVPSGLGNFVTVIRPSTGAILDTLTANGLAAPLSASFDGERVLVINQINSTLSLWKAAGMTPLGTVSTGASTFPFGACSDGINFWIALTGPGQLARF